MISSQTDYKLQPTDIIEIGDTILDWTDYFCHEEEIDTEALNMMGFSLIHSYEIVDPRNYKITIGRNPYNDIVINDPFVGCHHCTIYNLGDFFRLMNLDEHFSTYVNEKKAETEKNIWIFQHKDVIRLGNTILSWDEIRSTFENKRNNLISVEASNNHES
jgi:hypothetical protein